MRLSVVVPVLDEAARIGGLLAHLAAVPGIDEVVVVDGGSRDATRDVVAGAPGVRLLGAPRGRGQQLNAGARAARGDTLFFVHADTRPPRAAAAWIARALAEPGVAAGAFRIRTVADGPNPLGPLLRLADLRSRVARLPYGDQGLFVRRGTFERAGGYPAQPLFEDVELARRLWRLGRIVAVPAEMEVSGRRFQARPLRAALAMWCFPHLYRLGVSPERLARLYGAPR